LILWFSAALLVACSAALLLGWLAFLVGVLVGGLLVVGCSTARAARLLITLLLAGSSCLFGC